jgi:mono/diheme cytochrome c family protein
MDCLLCHWSAANGPARSDLAWRRRRGVSGALAQASSKAGLERLRAAATAGRRCFERGPACEDCHRPGGISPLARAGTSSARLGSLERLANYFTLAPGEKWYLPQLP